MSKSSAAPEAAPKEGRRKSRAPKARTPEPKEIISGAGHPLDPGVRRDLEARLGHDFSRVRVHSDRDAAALTELVGADAVTVGEDIFFAEGRFRPGTEDGRRLLAHELLHTVQAPHPLGALRAGRELGAVSLPQDAIEREAEQGAREPGREPAATPSATPGWLRYATVDAERYRTEKLDPATLVDRLAAGILRSLRGDPTDSSGRVRLQLVRFAPELQAAVLERLSDRMPSSDYARLLELVDVAEHDQAPDAVDAAQTPGPVTESADQADAEQGGQQPQPQVDQDVEQPAGKDGKDGKDGKKKRKGQGKDKDTKDQEQPEQPSGSQETQDEAPAAAAAPEAAAPTGPEQQAQPGPDQAPQAEQPEATVTEAAPAEAQPDTAQPAAVQPAAAQAVGSPQQEQKEAGARPTPGTRSETLGARQLPQPGPVKPERVDRIAEAKDSPLVQHGLLDGDQQQGEARDEERPLGLEPGADQDADPHAGEDKQAPPADATPELKPEDFLPSTDLDVSAVPTADQLTPPADGSAPAQPEVPTFPEPPETKAEQVQAARENEPQDETDPAPPQPAPGAPQLAPEPTPATEAEDRTTRDLQPERPVEQEIGPEPGTAATAPAAAEPAPAEPAATPEPTAEPTPEPTAAPEPAAAPDRAAPSAPGPVGGTGPAVADPAVAGPDAASPAPPGSVTEQADAPGELGVSPAPEASLEPGGGACAGPQQPTTEEEKAEDGGGGPAPGGAGGETKQEDKPVPPDVSGQDPQSALATAAGLPPDQMATTLDGVDGSVDRTVGEQHARLQSAPPSRERPAGAPQTQAGTPEAAPPAEAVSERLERVGPDGTTQDGRQADAKKAEGANPADQVAQPNVADDGSNQVSAQEAQQVQGAVNDVPTTDPALNVTVGPTPTVDLKGDSDPARTDQQQGKLKERSGKILGVGRDDAAKPMGEDRIYPDVPKETLTAPVPGASGNGGGHARGAVDTKPGIGVVTQQERGPQIQAAVGQGQGQLASEQAKQKQGEAEQRRQNQAEIDQSVADNAQAQAGERGTAADQVRTEREQWRTEQDQKTSEADKNSDAEHKDKNDQIGKKRTDTDKSIKDRQDTDNAQIQKNRQDAEDKARKKKEEKKEESSGWWGWVKSKVKQAFNALLDAVTGIFDYFRNLINGIIDAFKKFADSVIDAVRNFAIDLINKLADALIAICDVLLAAFPELRDKFRKKIEEWRDKAIAKVNELADKLKAAVNKLLDALAAGLNALLNALEAGLKAAIEKVRKAVLDAIDFVQKAIAMFGEFAALIGDIAPDPGGWLKKLGAAAMDGIQHYLWDAIKSAVKQWFNDKVESVVGLTSTLINILIKGCISMAQIGRMAWQAIVAALPGMIISIVVEKLVSMIVPAAGAIMTIIQGLMAAWNTISKIIAAIGKFVTFLKAVKSGTAAPLFAQAVASGVVALLDFITNFLLSRLKGAAKGVGTKLKGIAQKILKGLAKAGKGARKFAGRAVNKARATIRKASTALRRRPATTPTRPTRTGPARHTLRRAEPTNRHETTHPKTTRPQRPKSPVGRVLTNARHTVKAATTRIRQAARTLGRKLLNSKLGRALTNGAHRLRDAYRRQRDRLRDWHQKRQQQRAERRKRENSPEAKEARLARIVSRLNPKLRGLIKRGVRGAVLRATLGGMRLWYRLTELLFSGEHAVDFRATLNPTLVFLHGVAFVVDDLLAYVHKLSGEIARAPHWARQQGIPGAAPWRDPKDDEIHDVTELRGHEVQELMRRVPKRKGMPSEYLRHLRPPSGLVDVEWKQWFTRGPGAKNRGVYFQIRDKLLGGRSAYPWRDPNKKPKNMPSIALGYDELSNLFGSWKGPRSIRKQQAIARNALDVLAGGPLRGPNPRFTLEVVALMVHQETMRNVATNVTGAMLLDMAARGEITMQEAAAVHPMGILGAKRGGELLHQHLVGVDDPAGFGRVRSNNPDEIRTETDRAEDARMSRGAKKRKSASVLESHADNARVVRRREIEVIEAWVHSLGGEIVVDSEAAAEEKRQQLRRQIRERMHKMYGIDPRYTALRQNMDGL